MPIQTPGGVSRNIRLTVRIITRGQDDKLHKTLHTSVTLPDRQDAPQARKVLLPSRLWVRFDAVR